MNAPQRKEGFLLPLAILCILVVSMVALNGFGFIQQHTLISFHTKKTCSEYPRTKKTIFRVSI